MLFDVWEMRRLLCHERAEKKPEHEYEEHVYMCFNYL